MDVNIALPMLLLIAFGLMMFEACRAAVEVSKPDQKAGCDGNV